MIDSTSNLFLLSYESNPMQAKQCQAYPVFVLT